MSILIPGMEMPTEVCFVNVMLCNDGRVFVYKNGGWVKSGEAVPVPAHGDLIDKDALEKDIDNYIGGEESRSRFHHWIQVQSVVIPGDKEEET